MTQEDKELLLKDLCARLPYGVIIDSKEYNEAAYRKHYPQRLTGIMTLAGKISCIDVDDYPDPKCRTWKIDLCKPYLRPMSSMTEEEYEDFVKVLKRSMVCRKCYDWHEQWIQSPSVEEWLNKNHFDYRGLIEMGLALSTPEGMYNS